MFATNCPIVAMQGICWSEIMQSRRWNILRQRHPSIDFVSRADLPGVVSFLLFEELSFSKVTRPACSLFRYNFIFYNRAKPLQKAFLDSNVKCAIRCIVYQNCELFKMLLLTKFCGRMVDWCSGTGLVDSSSRAAILLWTIGLMKTKYNIYISYII